MEIASLHVTSSNDGFIWRLVLIDDEMETIIAKGSHADKIAAYLDGAQALIDMIKLWAHDSGAPA